MLLLLCGCCRRNALRLHVYEALLAHEPLLHVPVSLQSKSSSSTNSRNSSKVLQYIGLQLFCHLDACWLRLRAAGSSTPLPLLSLAAVPRHATSSSATTSSNGCVVAAVCKPPPSPDGCTSSAVPEAAGEAVSAAVAATSAGRTWEAEVDASTAAAAAAADEAILSKALGIDRPQVFWAAYFRFVLEANEHCLLLPLKAAVSFVVSK